MNPSAGFDQDAANALYGTLQQELRSRGLFEADTRAYVLRCCWLIPAYAGGWVGLQQLDGLGMHLLLAAVVAFASVQAAAIGHEAGHGAVSRQKWRVTLAGQFFMTFMMGNSYASWVHRHGRHHSYSNSGRDPDVRPGIFRFNEADARQARGLSRLFTCHQHILIWPSSLLMGFSLKGTGLVFAWRNRKSAPVDVVLLAVHLALWLVIPSWLKGPGRAVGDYLLITCFEGLHLAFIFLTNHLGRPTSDELKDHPYVYRQILTTRNITDSWLLTRICNGLNSHIEHHLFGQISYTKLTQARAPTKRLCEAYNIPYHEVSLPRAFTEFYHYNRRMAHVARQARGEPSARPAGLEEGARQPGGPA